MFKTTHKLLLVLSAVWLAASPVRAQEVLYGATGSNAVAGNLYIINPYTAATTLVGPITNAVGGGGIGITGLAFDPLSGLLYGITPNGTSGGNTVASSLVIIDPGTAIASVVGSLGFANSDISFRSDGTLFGYEAGGTFQTAGPRSMTTINLSTGTATRVGVANSNTQTIGGGLAFDPTGVLYLSALGVNSSLDTLTPATGARATGPPMSGSPSALGPGAALNSMAFNSTGSLFAIDTDRNGPTASSYLVTVNPNLTSGGAITAIGPLAPGNMDGLAFRPANKQIKIISKVGSTATITVGSNTGYTYQLQRSSTLLPGSFTNIGSSQTGTGGTLTFTDSTATGSADFYRVLISHGPQPNPGPLKIGRRPNLDNKLKQ